MQQEYCTPDVACWHLTYHKPCISVYFTHLVYFRRRRLLAMISREQFAELHCSIDIRWSQVPLSAKADWVKGQGKLQNPLINQSPTALATTLCNHSSAVSTIVSSACKFSPLCKPDQAPVNLCTVSFGILYHHISLAVWHWSIPCIKGVTD